MPLDLFARVPAGQQVPNLGLHVDRHLARRVGDGKALAYGTAQARRDLLRLPRELVALRRCVQKKQQREDHRGRTSARYDCSCSAEIGPSCFATMVPLASRMKVSGTPPTPNAIAVFPRSSITVG